MFVTKLFTISCLLSILTTNLTNGKQFLVETKENVKKNVDYKDGSEKKGECKEVECLPVLKLLFLLQICIQYSSIP